jgi:hypothetical protein
MMPRIGVMVYYQTPMNPLYYAAIGVLVLNVLSLIAVGHMKARKATTSCATLLLKLCTVCLELDGRIKHFVQIVEITVLAVITTFSCCAIFGGPCVDDRECEWIKNICIY